MLNQYETYEMKATRPDVWTIYERRGGRLEYLSDCYDQEYGKRLCAILNNLIKSKSEV